MSINQPTGESSISFAVRASLLATALFLFGGFMLALSVSPDPRGYGTHHQLGLPPCTFRTLFGYPCPGCGMTTCFAHFVRGDFPAAARANLAGLVLATVCALSIPWCLWSAYCKQLWMVTDPVTVGGTLAICLSGLAVLLWAARLIGATL